MIFNYLSLCLFGISVCLLSSTGAREAIIKGQIASIHDFPYQVALIGKKGVFCGGAIIGKSHILTAAHCVIEGNDQLLSGPIGITAGISNLNDPPAVGIVAKVLVPEEFSIVKMNTTGDIAVLKLEHPLNFKKHKHLKPVELPTRGVKHYIGKTGKVAGFGWSWNKVNGDNAKGGNEGDHLRFTEAHVLNDKDCQEIYEDVKNVAFNKEFCARVKQHEDGHFYGVCNGDSGSPFVLDGKTAIGILSRTLKPDCNEDKSAALYTRVVHYLSFIENAIEDKPHHDIKTYVVPEFA